MKRWALEQNSAWATDFPLLTISGYNLEMAVATCCYYWDVLLGLPEHPRLTGRLISIPCLWSDYFSVTPWHSVPLGRKPSPGRPLPGPRPPPPTAAPPNFRPLGSLPGGAGQPLQLLLPVNDLPSGPKDHFHSILFCLHLLAEHLNYSAVDKPVPVSSGLDCGSQRPWPVSKSIYFVSL